MTPFDDAAIEAGLARLPGWSRRDGSPAAIVRTFDCGSFPDAVAFVVRIGFLAERADHHPDLDVRWKRVTVVLSTHDAGGVTQRDLELAAQIAEAAP